MLAVGRKWNFKILIGRIMPAKSAQPAPPWVPQFKVALVVNLQMSLAMFIRLPPRPKMASRQPMSGQPLQRAKHSRPASRAWPMIAATPQTLPRPKTMCRQPPASVSLLPWSCLSLVIAFHTTALRQRRMTMMSRTEDILPRAKFTSLAPECVLREAF